MAIKSRRKATAPRKKPALLPPENYWCRKCMQHKSGTEFFSATDLFLDTNGKMSICKDCCNTIYDNYFMSELSMDKAIYKTCKSLNVRFDTGALESLKTQLDTYKTNGKETDNIFGIYKGRLLSVQNTRLEKRDNHVDMTFSEPETSNIPQSDIGDDEESVDLKQFWGNNFSYDDYVFLEKELDEWKKTHKADTKAEITLLKELCYKSLEIRKARISERPTSSMVKELQELMKTASVDPAKTSQAGSGKAQDTFSSFIQIIEQNEPAEFYKDKELFKDFDNIDFYFKKYLTRPLKNFITQSRDFNVEVDDDEDDFDSISDPILSGEETEE